MSQIEGKSTHQLDKAARAKASLDALASLAKEAARDLGDLELDCDHDPVVNIVIAHLALTVTLADLLRDDRADNDRWARIRVVAAAISDADLEDETDVVRALYASRFAFRNFGDILDEAIDLAREHAHVARGVKALRKSLVDSIEIALIHLHYALADYHYLRDGDFPLDPADLDAPLRELHNRAVSTQLAIDLARGRSSDAEA